MNGENEVQASEQATPTGAEHSLIVDASITGREPVTIETLNGVERIATERERQIAVEGFDADHDDSHESGELLRAAGCYLEAVKMHRSGVVRHIADFAAGVEWPWHPRDFFKPSEDPIKNLAKAGALIAAEIDRLKRKALAK